MHLCLNCGCDISERRSTAKRCPTCAKIKDKKDSADKCKAGEYRTTWGNPQHMKIKREAHIQQGYCCTICGWTIEGTETGACAIHHITPIGKGGEDSIDNVVVLCPNCHALADAGLITQAQLHGLVDVARNTRPDLSQITEIINTKLRPINTYA